VLSAADVRFMRVAVDLSRRALGVTAENPPVGAIIVSKDRIVGRGVTQSGGRPHAEPVAIREAGPASVGATLYVTLEPCSHTGKSPPCADAVIAAGISRVVIACGDPDPRVSGRGIASLRDAGIQVDVDCEVTRAACVLDGFFSRIKRGRPMVSLKLATSLDGKIALSNGDSKWITGTQARSHGHLLRAQHDAILVGSGTALSDQPALTCRINGVKSRNPKRVFLDRRGRLQASDVADWADSPALIYTQKPLPSSVAHVENAAYPHQLENLLSDLGSRGVNNLLIEGGGEIAAAFLGANLVDRIYHYQAAKVIGADGRPCAGTMLHTSLADITHWQNAASRMLGRDRLAYYRRPE